MSSRAAYFGTRCSRLLAFRAPLFRSFRLFPLFPLIFRLP